MRDRVATYQESSSRSRALRLASAACCILFAATLAGCGASRNEPSLEFTGEQQIKSAGQVSFTHPLAAGVYLVEVRELGIDLRASITGDGPASDLEDLAARHGRVFAVIEMPKAGDLHVQISSVDHATMEGRALVRISRFRRAPGQAPDELEAGYVAMSGAACDSAQSDQALWPRAADGYAEAITRFENSGNDAARAQAAYALANLQYYARDEWAAAVRAAEIADDAFDSADDETGMHNARALRAAAELEIASGMNAGTQKAEQRALYAAADRRLSDAATYFASHELPIRAAYAVNMRGIRALNTGDYVEAGKLFSQAVGMSRANHDVAEQARSLGNLAWVHRQQGFVAQAASEYEALLPLFDREQSAYEYGVVLANYGFCLTALGDFDGAMERHAEALAVFTQVGDQDERATELAALGGLYFRIGDTQRALKTLRNAIEEQERVSDTRGLAGTLRVAGNAASAAGQHDLALEYLRRSARIDANPHNVARSRVLIAGELRVLGNLSAAAPELEAALSSDNAMVRANGLEERARLRQAQRDLPGAIADLREADRQYRELSLDFNRIDTSTALAMALLASKDVPAASAAADEAVAIVSRIRVKSGNPEWRARFLSSRYSPFEARIAVDFAASGTDDPSASWRAFRTAEEIRARSLADQLAFESRNQASPDDPQVDELRARLTSLQVRLENRMQRADADEEGTLALRRDIEETRAKIDAARVRGTAVQSSDLALPATLAEVQAKLPANTAVLAYFVGDSQSHGWLLTRQSLRHAQMPGREALQRAIDAAFNAPKGAPVADRPLAQTLFGHLLDDAQANRLLVLPDGPLNGVPFAALPIPGASDEILINRFVLGYAPSLALAMQQHAEAARRGTRVAVISDPVYAPDDPRLGSQATSRSRREPSPDNLIRLPYSALEAKAVKRAFGDRGTIDLSGFEATSQRVLELPWKDLAVLHVATHAIARKDSPEQSALYLSAYSPEGALLPDTRLTTTEITRHRLRADLVVLSGCATGDGSALRGEGVLGLTYGFLANGSRSVVASLWSVEDASTARFMNEFYRAFRATGSASEALRSAQLRTRGSTPVITWSSFVVRANGFP